MAKSCEIDFFIFFYTRTVYPVNDRNAGDIEKKKHQKTTLISALNLDYLAMKCALRCNIHDFDILIVLFFYKKEH